MENTFTYFTANKWMYKYPGINAGDVILTPNSTKSAWQKMESVKNGLGGKSDAYLLYADSSGAPYRSIPTTGTESGNRDVLEMSVYVPSESKGAKLEIGIYAPGYKTDGTRKFTTLPLLIKNDGLYTDFSDGPNKFYTLEPDRWYNVAFVTPLPYTGAVDSDGHSLDSNVTEMYVNGVLIDRRPVTYSPDGLRHLRLTSYGTPTLTPVIYLDNIRVHSGNYESQYDRLADISYKDGIDANNNIIVKGQTTVAQLKAGITKEDDTAIRVYSGLTSTTEMADTDYVSNGTVVVAAAMNNSEMERSYNYYTVNKIKNEVEVSTLVNGAQAKLYDSDDTLSVTADFANYTEDETFNVTMYTAQYKYGELVKLWQDSKTVAAGSDATLTCDFADMEDRTNSTIKVMLVDENLEPYAKTATMRFNNENTQATLYLLGDSIVQTYVDPGYPIQGWGYYIDDYLNDNITVENRATSGWTTDHYLYPDGIYTREDGVSSAGMELKTTGGSLKKVGESNRYKIWSNILSELKAGDYVMVSLGINDMGSGNVPADRYLENITTIYNDATAKGATVLFSTPTISGRVWDYSANFGEGWGGYGVICKNFATPKGDVCIPLGATLVNLYNGMVTEYMEENNVNKVTALNYVRNYFHIYAENGTPPEGWTDFGNKTTDDSTHHNVVSSNLVAKIIAQLILESGSPLGDYVVIPQ